jgi:hypothetical protein
VAVVVGLGAEVVDEIVVLDLVVDTVVGPVVVLLSVDEGGGAVPPWPG